MTDRSIDFGDVDFAWQADGLEITITQPTGESDYDTVEAVLGTDGAERLLMWLLATLNPGHDIVGRTKDGRPIWNAR